MAWPYQKENDPLRLAIEWILQGKMSRGRPQKRWLDEIEEDVGELGVENWEDQVQDGDRWQPKTLGE